MSKKDADKRSVGTMHKIGRLLGVTPNKKGKTPLFSKLLKREDQRAK